MALFIALYRPSLSITGRKLGPPCVAVSLSYDGVFAIFIFEPKLVHRVDKDKPLALLLNDVLVLQRLFVLDDRVGVSKSICQFGCLRGEMRLTFDNGFEHLNLCGTEVFGVILKHRSVDIEHLFQSKTKNIFCHLCDREAPHEIAKLLKVPRVARHDVANSVRILLGYGLSRLLERMLNEGYPVLLVDFAHKDDLSKTIERTA